MVIQIVYPAYLTLFQSKFLNVAIHSNQINVSFVFSLCRLSHGFQVFLFGADLSSHSKLCGKKCILIIFSGFKFLFLSDKTSRWMADHRITFSCYLMAHGNTWFESWNTMIWPCNCQQHNQVYTLCLDPLICTFFSDTYRKSTV